MRDGLYGPDRLGRIALYYLVFASLWILSSDLLLSWTMPWALAWGGTVKGLLFVAVTAALLHLLIRNATRRERVHAERARAVVAAVSDGVLVLDPRGTICDFNDAAQRLLSLHPSETGLRSVWTLLPAGTEASWRALRDEVEGERELEMLRGDGSPFPASWRLRRTTVMGREMRVAFLEDLTAGKALERQLVQAQKMESVGRLAAGVTHDLNNLLTVVLGHAECLRDRMPAGDPGRTDVEAIQRTAERAAILSRQLLAFSRQQIVRREVLELNALILGMEPMLRGLAGENVALEIRTCPEACPTVADPNRLEQVVVNLAVNSRDAMPEGGRLVVGVSSRELEEGDLASDPGIHPGSFCEIRVSDTGEGMDEQTMTRIFDPFFTTKAPGEGTGLGLSMVYGIVQQFGGVVRVDSQPGRGTEFRVLLPKVAIPAGGAPAPSPAAAQPPGRTGSILLVEDDPDLRDLVRRLLERGGHQVLPAGSAPEAFRLLTDRPDGVDLLLTDIGLPGMDGSELARRFRSMHPATPVLLMSAYTGAHRSQGAEFPPDARMLQKPFTGTQLMQQVQEALEEGNA